MQEEIMAAWKGHKGNRAAGVADRTKEMEVGPFHWQRQQRHWIGEEIHVTMPHLSSDMPH